MMSDFKVDINDIIKFAPVAYRSAAKKGPLSDKDRHLFCCLLGNLLFCFERDDVSTLYTIIFLESSSIRLSMQGQSSTTYPFTVTTMGGKSTTLFAASNVDRQDWMDAIESNKFISMYRKFEDIEASTSQLHYRVEEQDNQLTDLETKLEKAQREILDYQSTIQERDSRIRDMESDLMSTNTRLKSAEAERLLLLKSKGITPKKLPLWALSDGGRESVEDMPVNAKIWVGTWNVGSIDPFCAMEKERAHRLLQPFVPKGYDMYVIGVQECTSDSVFECLEGLLAGEGCVRVCLNKSDSQVTPSAQDKLYGASDGSLLAHTYTSLAIFVNRKLRADVHLLAVSQVLLVQNKGAVAAALSVFGRTIVFVSALFENKYNDTRRNQYRSLVTALGEQLAESGFHLNEQFHHVIWCGSFNYQLVDTSGASLPPDMVVRMLEDNLNRTLFETHDQLNRERRAKLLFYGYREPAPFPNFFPSHKKYRNRLPLDYDHKSWVRECYDISLPKMFSVAKESGPSFCDRVLYYSIEDMAEDLIPECVNHDLSVCHSNVNIEEEPVTPKPNMFAMSSGKLGLTSPAKLPNTIKATIDNYQAVNDGEALAASDHSPVFATFVLRTAHDFDTIKKEVHEQGQKGVRTMLSIMSTSTSNPNFQKINNTDLSEISIHDKNDRAPSATPLAGSKDSSKQSDAMTPLMSIVRCALLPPGNYTVRLHNVRLMWGDSDKAPLAVKLLFPAPYETMRGETFVDFFSEPEQAEEGPATSLSGKSKSGSRSTTPSKHQPKTSSSSATTRLHWRRSGASKTGTCCMLELDAGKGVVEAPSSLPGVQLTWRGGEPLDKLHIVLQTEMLAASYSTPTANRKSSSFSQTGQHRASSSFSGSNAANMGSTPAGNASSSSSAAGGSGSGSGASNDRITGHCVLGLEQMCKRALLDRASGTTTETRYIRILQREGLPLNNFDPVGMQKEQVKLSCQIELLPF